MKWIKCNLPWTFYGKWEDGPQAPDLSKQIKEKFGTTPDKMKDSLPEYYDKDYKKLYKKYRAFHKKVNVWCEEHILNKEYKRKYIEYSESLKKKSFCGRGLNKPGTKIQIRDNNKLKVLIIGDINEYGGVCDDCMAFESDKAVVVKYMPLK